MSVGVARAHPIVGRFCAAMLTAGAMLGVPVGIPSAAAQPCPDIDVTFARGLGDAPGPGPLGDAFINSLRSKVGGRSVGVYGVNYAASSNFLTVSDGVADATNHVNDMIANCPAARLVLGGFSEGAAVVDFLVGAAPSVPAIPGVPGIPGGLPPLPDIPGLPVALPGLDILSGTGPTNPLPPAAVDHVAAVAVFGNPLTRVSGPLNGLAGPYGPKTIDLCHAGDPLCGGGGDWNAHHEYVPGLTDQAAAFVAGLVQALLNRAPSPVRSTRESKSLFKGTIACDLQSLHSGQEHVQRQAGQAGGGADVLSGNGTPQNGLTDDGLRFAIFYTKLHHRLLRPLLAADNPPAPPPLRNALRTIDIHITERIDQARLLPKAA